MAQLDAVRLEANFGDLLAMQSGEIIATQSGSEISAGAAWTNIYADVVGPVKIKRGLPGAGPKDLVAVTGIMLFKLNNSKTNSGNTPGWYSPDHSSKRSVWGLGTSVRIALVHNGTDYYKFFGKITDISPDFGSHKKRQVKVKVADIIDQLAVRRIQQLSAQQSKRNDQVLTTIMASLEIAALNTSFDTGVDTFTWALINDVDEQTTMLSAIQKAMQSDLGNFFVKGNSTDGENVVYETRQNRSVNTTIEAVFTDDMQGLQVKRNTKDIFNRVRVTSHPVQVSATATDIVFSLDNEIVIQPGTAQAFPLTANYRDPDNPNVRISATEVVDPLVADTHYRFSSIADDGGNDLNSSLTVTLTKIGANSVLVTLENTGTIAGNLNKLDIVGKGIFIRNPIEYSTENSQSIFDHGERPLLFALPNNVNPNIGVDFGNYLLSAHKSPQSFSNLEMFGSKNDTFLGYATSLDIGSQISVLETQTGIDGNFFIQNISLEIMGRQVRQTKYTLKASLTAKVWALGTVGKSELGATTFPTF